MDRAFRVPPFGNWWMGWRFTTSFWAEKAGDLFQISCLVCRCVGGGYLVVKVRDKLTRCEADKLEVSSVFLNLSHSLPIQNLLQKTNYKCNKNIYLCIYSFSYMLHMQLVQHSIIFPVLFYLNLHFSLLIRVIQNPSIITIFTIHIPKIHSFTFWNCFISFP